MNPRFLQVVARTKAAQLGKNHRAMRVQEGQETREIASRLPFKNFCRTIVNSSHRGLADSLQEARGIAVLTHPISRERLSYDNAPNGSCRRSSAFHLSYLGSRPSFPSTCGVLRSLSLVWSPRHRSECAVVVPICGIACLCAFGGGCWFGIGQTADVWHYYFKRPRYGYSRNCTGVSQLDQD